MQPRAMIRRVLPAALLLLATLARADDPALGPTAAGQAVADALKDFTSSDVALVPAGLLREPEKEKRDDVASALAFENDGVVVVSLSGAKLREALERSVSAFPQSSVGFLQIAGIEAGFKKNAPANARLTTIVVGGAKLEDGKIYTVAMPLSLQQGQLGYANLWEDSKIVRRFDKTTLGAVVKGRRVGTFVSRWSPQG